MLLFTISMRLVVEETKLRDAKRPGRARREGNRQREDNIQQMSQRQKQHVDVDGMENEGVSYSTWSSARRPGKSSRAAKPSLPESRMAI